MGDFVVRVSFQLSEDEYRALALWECADRALDEKRVINRGSRSDSGVVDETIQGHLSPLPLFTHAHQSHTSCNLTQPRSDLATIFIATKQFRQCDE